MCDVISNENVMKKGNTEQCNQTSKLRLHPPLCALHHHPQQVCWYFPPEELDHVTTETAALKLREIKHKINLILIYKA